MLTASALAMCGLASEWWLTFADRTGHRFAELIVERRTEAVIDMIDNDLVRREIVGWMDLVTTDWNEPELQYGRRTPIDLVCARREFQILGTHMLAPPCQPGASDVQRTVKLGLRFCVERDRVSQVTRALVLSNSNEVILLGQSAAREKDNSQWNFCRIDTIPADSSNGP